MRVAALFSGGKDSVFSVYITQQYGWEVSPLVSLLPKKPDSWMFHSVNIHQTGLLAQAINIPLVTRDTSAEKETELEDLTEVLQSLEIDGVVSGAIASEYQRTRIERVCDRLGIKSFTPLWHKNQELLLRDQINAGFHIIIVGVFAEGFDETWLGRTIDRAAIDELVHLHEKHGINIAGEGGEYETLVLSGPVFSKKLVIDESIKQWNRDSGTFQVKTAHLQDV
ncbi:MAG TPA: TIGR00289 family protein [Thermoplasmata archaeon]|jgi:diphthine-ammonia ligase|nr:TIGR00289 family protein [Thermoplasmata archaeon]HIH28899.1 TIGR00289 family protein [Thermoplasmata archaeon]